ncbi:hypothetical protein SAMN05443377_10380 [Propionibacterium cyclohexanicum]|uniref:Uncharacterized protein n=1 Tax=Propionibacterium cyclohexanicum TaxID=64702 RepID=A0A1H9QFC2_9ACTN|nr:hypothetical protein SAMN05443377_10380 [Propionibacterium cyclohexanicum]
MIALDRALTAPAKTPPNPELVQLNVKFHT